MSLWTAISLAGVFAATWIGVGAYRRLSLRRELLDHPNERSSHTVPTPRGGGVVIFLVCLAAYAAYCFASGAHPRWSFVAGALLVGGVSLADDIRHVPSGIRFGIHSLAAVLVIAETGGFGTVAGIAFGWWPPAGVLAAFVWIVWMTNAFNFMDGIDGIAATQALTAGVTWYLIAAAAGEPAAGFLGLALACSASGFLLHNWEPARIFMGDVGSAFLGFAFAVLPLLRDPGPARQDLFALFAVFPVWFFLFDSVLTFVRRLVRREKVWRAHREHLYQRLVISGARHRKVTLLYGLLSAAVAVAVFHSLREPDPGVGAVWATAAAGSAVLCALTYAARRRAGVS
jgi:UDP-N-acetylmuramyl pentapeptide phosphotransferase/UDP-N-acetylglucosamine-1-phosphate transferase